MILSQPSKVTQVLKADKLYEILPSRVGAYLILLNVSREINRFGHLMILEDAQIDCKLSCVLEDCNKSEFTYQIINLFFLVQIKALKIFDEQ